MFIYAPDGIKVIFKKKTYQFNALCGKKLRDSVNVVISRGILQDQKDSGNIKGINMKGSYRSPKLTFTTEALCVRRGGLFPMRDSLESKLSQPIVLCTSSDEDMALQ